MRAAFILRVRLIGAAIIIFILLLVVRLYYIQVVEGETYADRANRQYINPGETLFDRGSIYFTDKDGNLISAATLATGFVLAINPKLLGDSAETYSKLNAIVPLDREKFFAQAAKKEDPYEELVHHISVEAGTAIVNLDLPGVSIYREKWRYYPAGALAGNTIGFVGSDGVTLSGRYGLERYYEDTLTRSARGYDNFFSELFANVKDLVSASTRGEGEVITSIEPTVERKLEDTLEEIGKRWDSKLTGGIILDPKTGSVYGLGVYPTFDPNHFSDVSNISILANPLIDRVYEMGSIVKPLTMAAGLDTGVVTAKTTFYDPGCMTLDKKTFCNFDGKGRGTVPMQEVLNQSLNTGAAFVEAKVGNQRFATYLEKFGIGEETGIDLPNESAGIVDNLKTPRDIEYANASFGQGFAVTPIAMARALAALGNHGKLVTPHVATKIKYRSGLTEEVKPLEGEQVIKPETADEITRMLVEVVDTALLEGKMKLEHYSIAAKTGTAQIAKPGGGGYYDDRYLHSFFGYFPAYEPRFIVFLYTVEPVGVKYASQTLAEPFKDIADFLINYYAIAPDR